MDEAAKGSSFLPVSGIVRIQFERPQEVRDEAMRRFVQRVAGLRLRDRAEGTVAEPAPDADPLECAAYVLELMLPETDDVGLVERHVSWLIGAVLQAHEEAFVTERYPTSPGETVADYGRIMKEAARRLASIPPEVRHEVGLPPSPETQRSLADRCERWAATAIPTSPPHRPADEIKGSLDQAAIFTIGAIEGAVPSPYAARVRRLAHLLYYLAGFDDSEEAVKQSVAAEARKLGRYRNPSRKL